MNLQSLFARFQSPEEDLGGGGADAQAGDAAGSEAAAPTMEDTIREKYRELTGEQSGEEAGGEDSAPSEPKHKSQPRQNGRFAKEAAAVSPGTEGDQQQASSDQGDQQAPADQLKPHDQLPNTWRKELAEEWKALPERTRQEIHRREQDMHNGLRQYKDAAGFGQSIAREMQPYQQIMQKNGVTPQAIVRDIMGALNTMATGSDESKASTFLQLARSYGINLDQVMSLHTRAPSQLPPEFTALKQELGEVRNRLTQADQERELALQREDDAAVNRFLNDPKKPHAKAVSQQMAALLTSGQAKDLDDAYEQAIWLHPDVRQKLLTEQETERRKKEEDAARKARQASSTNVQRRGTPPAPAQKGTMDDTIRNKYRELMG